MAGWLIQISINTPRPSDPVIFCQGQRFSTVPEPKRLPFQQLQRPLASRAVPSVKRVSCSPPKPCDSIMEQSVQLCKQKWEGLCFATAVATRPIATALDLDGVVVRLGIFGVIWQARLLHERLNGLRAQSLTPGCQVGHRVAIVQAYANT